MLKRREIENALKRKGFRQSNRDHKFFIYFTKEGKKTIVSTKISHGTGHSDIGSNLVNRMARQCKLTSREFNNLVKCLLSRDRYERELDKQGAI